MKKRSTMVLLVACLSGVAPLWGARIPSFRGLGSLSPAGETSSARAVSADGTVVVGIEAVNFSFSPRIGARFLEDTIAVG
jgi:hypothetical protein